jgi:hypothetical protein
MDCISIEEQLALFNGLPVVVYTCEPAGDFATSPPALASLPSLGGTLQISSTIQLSGYRTSTPMTRRW